LMLGILSFFLFSIMVGAALTVFLMIAYIGLPRMRLAYLMAKVARSKNPKLLLALVRTGRTVLPVVLRYKGNKYWWGRIFGRPALWAVSPESVYRFAGTDVVVTTSSIARTLAPQDLVKLEALSSEFVHRHVLEQAKAAAEDILMDERHRLQRRLAAAAAKLEAGEPVEEELARIESALAEIDTIIRKIREANTLSELVDALKKVKPVRDYVFHITGLAVNFDLVDPISAIDPVSLETIAESRRLQVVADILGEKREEQRRGGFAILLVAGVIIVLIIAALLLFR